MKTFCKSLRAHAIKLTNFNKKKNEIINKRAVGFIWKNKKSVIFVKKNLKINIWKIYHKVRDHCHYTGKYRGAVHSICNLKYNIPNKIPVVFHNGSNYDYNFIIRELAEEFKKQFTCLGKNSEKYILLQFQ